MRAMRLFSRQGFRSQFKAPQKPQLSASHLRFFSSSQSRAEKVANNYVDCVNRRDIDSLLKLMCDDYHSDQPLHPGRSFQGVDIVRQNHEALFSVYDDIKVTVKSVASSDQKDLTEAFLEVEWALKKKDGSQLQWKGVIIFGLAPNDALAYGRLYMEPVGAAEVKSSNKRSLVERLVSEAEEDAKAGYRKMKNSMDMP